MPGVTDFEVTVSGSYFSDSSIVYFDGQPLPTDFVDPTHLLVIVPAFTGNPMLQVYNPPTVPNVNDGGFSNGYYFYNSVKPVITVRADNSVKYYGESLPAFTSTILVDGQPLSSTSLADRSWPRRSAVSDHCDAAGAESVSIRSCRSWCRWI